MAIVAVPLYFVGYWHLFERLRPAGVLIRRVVLLMGIYSFFLGGVWIGSRVYLALLVQAAALASNEAASVQLVGLLDRAQFYNETILIGLRVGILLVSGIFSILVVSGRTNYPRWFAVLNPICLVVASFILYAIVPSIGGYLMPIAMNVAHFVLFGASVLLMWRERPARVDSM